MSRRNLILLIIVLVIATAVVALLFYSNQTIEERGGEAETSGGFFSNLNPFKGGPQTTPPYVTPVGEEETNTEIPVEETEKKILTRVSGMPIAGYGVFQKERLIPDLFSDGKEQGKREFAPAIRYVDRATGEIYQTFVDDIAERKFSNTIVPKVYEALLGNNGQTIIMRYLKNDRETIQTFVINLPEEKLGEIGSPTEIKGVFLPDNITDLILSPDTTKIFYLLPAGENAVGIIMNLKDNKKTQVVDLSFTEWLSSLSKNTVFLTTKASALTEGFMYSADLVKKSLTREIGGLKGLTALPNPAGGLVIISDSGLNLGAYDIKTKELKSLGIRTLTEKCVWAGDDITVYCAVPKTPSGALYPDWWYQGEISFNDQVWKIDTKSGIIALVSDLFLENGGEEIDAVKLSLDQKEDYLFFINRKNSFLWKLNLK